MKRFILSGCILILAVSESFAGDCQHKVTLFLSNPSYKNYLELYSNESTIDSDSCWPEIKKDVHKLARLYKYTKQGNKWAIKILIKHTSDLDGGELEDAYIALGESLDIKPRILLVEFKEKKMTENQFTQAVEMLSLSFVDNKKGTLTALEARKRKILSVKDAGLKEQKELAVKAINSQIKWILERWPNDG
ncbi:MAG: hypothetical protein M0Z67_00530, partial [Nitrospiraceae bacterium]|nr:hypothetical protein [Nitrospiraceae bacterium]